MQDVTSTIVIRLSMPKDGAVTPPLQRVAWKADIQWFGAGERQEEDEDRGQPRPVYFAWEEPNVGFQLQYELAVSTDPTFRKDVLLRSQAEPFARVPNLRVGQPYFWKVTAWQGLCRVGESAVGSFETHPAAPRWIHVPGITNVRDIGGWRLPGGHRVRQGMIYRGSEMNSHCTILPEGERVLVEDLGIHTDLDLRGVGERCRAVLDKHKVEYLNIPVQGYDLIADPEYTGRYRMLFSLLADRQFYPIYMHCWGGADRTGTVAFLLGALLGMEEEDLLTDYELTSLSTMGERSRASEAFRDLLSTLELFTSKGSSIQRQVERYMQVIGVTGAEIERIREYLTD